MASMQCEGFDVVPRRKTYCDIELSLTGFRLHVAEQTAVDPRCRSTVEIPFAVGADWDKVQVLSADVLADVELEFVRAFLPETLLIRGAIADAVPERLRELSAIRKASEEFRLPLSELRATFLRERFALQYIICEVVSLLDVETYPPFRKLGLSAICAHHPVLAHSAVVLHVCRGVPLLSSKAARIEQAYALSRP